MLTICLLGQRANRIPLAYESYRLMCQGRLAFTNDPLAADIILFSFLDDLRQAMPDIECAMRSNPSLRVAMLSEEPLWDTLWGGAFTRKHQSSNLTGFSFDYTFLNHQTTSIYEFATFPYFITTCDNYYLRYSNLFKRNAGMGVAEIRSIWASATFRQAYLAEKRLGQNFEIKGKLSDEIVGLCSYRSELAELASGTGVLRVGQGWGDQPRRQVLPDWHLDKLATLDRQSFIVSALENTHMQDYVTEKIFDGFAVLGVPVYYASPQHAIHRIFPEGGFINLYGLTPTAAAKRIMEFSPDDGFISAYHATQLRLSAIFSNPQAYWNERKRLLESIIAELNNLSA